MVDLKAGIRTFMVIHAIILVHEVVGDGILIHYTAKEGLHVVYNILDWVSTTL